MTPAQIRYQIDRMYGMIDTVRATVGADERKSLGTMVFYLEQIAKLQKQLHAHPDYDNGDDDETDI